MAKEEPDDDPDYCQMDIEEMEPQDLLIGLMKLITGSHFDYDFLRKLYLYARENSPDCDKPVS